MDFAGGRELEDIGAAQAEGIRSSTTMRVLRRWRRASSLGREADGGASSAPALDWKVEWFEYVPVDGERALVQLGVEGDGLDHPIAAALEVRGSRDTRTYSALPTRDDEQVAGWRAAYDLPLTVLTTAEEFGLRADDWSLILPFPDERSMSRAQDTS